MSTSVIFSVNFNANVKFNPSKINFILTINRDVKIAPTIEEDKCPGDLILESTTTTTQSLFLSAERAKRPLDNADKIKEENCCCSRLSIVSMAGDFLKGLPSFNKENFTRFHADGVQSKSTSKRPSVYIQFTEEQNIKPQVIITDKTNILLRYLRKQSDVKNLQQKRNLSSTDNASPSRKVPRLGAANNDDKSTEND